MASSGRQTSRQKTLERALSGNYEQDSDSEHDPLPSKRRQVAAVCSKRLPAENSQFDNEKLNDMLRGFDKRLEETDSQMKLQQLAQHTLIETINLKISSTLQQLTDRVSRLEKSCIQEFEKQKAMVRLSTKIPVQQSVEHQELFEKRMGKFWANSQSALDRVVRLEEEMKGLDGKSAALYQNAVHEINILRKEIGNSMNHTSLCQSATDGRIDRLEEEVKALALEQSGMTSQVSQRSVTDSQINDLIRSNRIIMMRLAAVEEKV